VNLTDPLLRFDRAASFVHLSDRLHFALKIDSDSLVPIPVGQGILIQWSLNFVWPWIEQSDLSLELAGRKLRGTEHGRSQRLKLSLKGRK
jgi:hypothetical protein